MSSVTHSMPQWQIGRADTERAGLITRAQRLARRCLLLILGIWAATVVLHEIDIGGTWLPLHTATWVLLAAWLASFAASYGVTLLHSRANPILPAAPPPDEWWARWVTTLSIIALIGASLIIYDFAVLRGYGFATSVTAIRMEEGTAAIRGLHESSPVSGLGRLMIPAILLAYMLAITHWRRLARRARLTLLLSSIVTLGEQLLFEGGRFFITALVTVVIICYFLRPPYEARAPRKRIPVVRLAIASAILLSFFSYVFVDRILDRDDFFWSAYLNFTRDFTIYVDYQEVSRFDGPFGGLWFSLCMLWLYVTQGFNELDQILGLSYFSHAGGLYQIPHAGPIANILFGSNLEYDLMANLPNMGTYVTFYGANYIDFGHVGAFLSAILLGGFMARGLLSFASGRLNTIALIGPMLLVVGFFTPVVSIITNLWPAMLWAIPVGITAKIRQ